MLQSVVAIFNFLCWLLRGDFQWKAVTQAYPVSTIALWLAALVWSAVALVSITAFWRGWKWGRLVYACGAVVWVAGAFLLAPWQVALSGAIMPLLMAAILCSRKAGRYLSDDVASQRSTQMRDRVVCGAWGFATVYYHAIFFMQLTNEGWLADVLVDGIRLMALSAVPLISLIALSLTRQGERIWSLGLFLTVSGTAEFFVLLGYVPYTRLAAAYLGPGYQGYAIPWALATMWVAFLLLIGFVLLLIVRFGKSGGRAGDNDFGDDLSQ
ncbi:hypothetical protein ACI2S3_24240 [Ralstonia nicotianae]